MTHCDGIHDAISHAQDLHSILCIKELWLADDAMTLMTLFEGAFLFYAISADGMGPNPVCETNPARRRSEPKAHQL
jgi:hypothetical protein